MRRASDDEKRLFRQAVARANPRARLPHAPAWPSAARPQAGGLDGNTSEKMKRGQLVPQRRIDLHGLTQERAHRSLLAFLQAAWRDGARLVLVVTGKGNPALDETAAWARPRHGALKEMVPRWLGEAQFANLIAATAPAHARHGGGGALYVYLRKNRPRP